MEGMMMIDAIQRLGIDYHFEEEIEAVLQKQYMKANIHGDCDEDLYEVALRFRLLRQEGYTVPAGGFFLVFIYFSFLINVTDINQESFVSESEIYWLMCMDRCV